MHCKGKKVIKKWETEETEKINKMPYLYIPVKV